MREAVDQDELQAMDENDKVWVFAWRKALKKEISKENTEEILKG